MTYDAKDEAILMIGRNSTFKVVLVNVRRGEVNDVLGSAPLFSTSVNIGTSITISLSSQATLYYQGFMWYR